MPDRQGPPEALFRPGHDAGGRVPAHEQPEDLRDTVGADKDELRRPASGVDPLVDDPPRDVDPYPPPTAVERPQRAQPASSPRSTPDASLSRAADRAAAGRDPLADGFERPVPEPGGGPLGPRADEQPSGAEGEPAGQSGSSGEPAP